MPFTQTISVTGRIVRPPGPGSFYLEGVGSWVISDQTQANGGFGGSATVASVFIQAGGDGTQNYSGYPGFSLTEDAPGPSTLTVTGPLQYLRAGHTYKVTYYGLQAGETVTGPPTPQCDEVDSGTFTIPAKRYFFDPLGYDGSELRRYEGARVIG